MLCMYLTFKMRKCGKCNTDDAKGEAPLLTCSNNDIPRIDFLPNFSELSVKKLLKVAFPTPIEIKWEQGMQTYSTFWTHL